MQSPESVGEAGRLLDQWEEEAELAALHPVRRHRFDSIEAIAAELEATVEEVEAFARTLRTSPARRRTTSIPTWSDPPAQARGASEPLAGPSTAAVAPPSAAPAERTEDPHVQASRAARPAHADPEHPLGTSLPVLSNLNQARDRTWTEGQRLRVGTTYYTAHHRARDDGSGFYDLELVPERRT